MTKASKSNITTLTLIQPKALEGLIDLLQTFQNSSMYKVNSIAYLRCSTHLLLQQGEVEN